MAFESDRMTGLNLTPDVIDAERNVVMEERRLRIEQNPSAMLSEAMDAALYQNHRYGVPVIGWMPEIQQLNREDALAFYKLYYAPNNATVVIAGDVDANEVKALAEKTYVSSPSNPALKARKRVDEPVSRAARIVELQDDRVQQPSWSRTYMVAGYNKPKNGTAEALEF